MKQPTFGSRTDEDKTRQVDVVSCDITDNFVGIRGMLMTPRVATAAGWSDLRCLLRQTVKSTGSNKSYTVTSL